MRETYSVLSSLSSANILLNRSHAAGFSQKLADRPEMVRMLSPFDRMSQHDIVPTPLHVTDLLAVEPLIVAEAITLHESRLFSLVTPTELTSTKRGAHITALIEWEQKMGERLTSQVRTHSQDKKSRVDAVVREEKRRKEKRGEEEEVR